MLGHGYEVPSRDTEVFRIQYWQTPSLDESSQFPPEHGQEVPVLHVSIFTNQYLNLP